MVPYVYLDYAASAPLRNVAREVEMAYESSAYAGANPNSLHSLGRAAARALDDARRELARCVGGGFRASDVVFTSGGTENNNLAIVGMAHGAKGRSRARTRVLLSAIEHDSGLDLAPALREQGFDVELLRPGRDGVVAPKTLERALDNTVGLVSVMLANNETGVIQPIEQLGSLAHDAGALFYTDAAQGFAKVRADFSQCDGVGIVGHKIGAPVGTGALLVRTRCPIRPRFFGGGQERGVRPGTQDVRGAMALSATARSCMRDLDHTRSLVAGNASRLYGLLCGPDTGIVPTTRAVVDDARLPGIVSVMVPGVDSESLVLQMDARGFGVSASSACASGSLDPSHVLAAMGIARTESLGSLRISFDERVTWDDLERFGNELLDVVQVLKRRG